MSGDTKPGLTEAERDQLAVWWDDNNVNSSMNALCREVAAIVKAREAAARREALEEAAEEFQEDMADVWGGNAPWMTSGVRVANLVAELLRDRAEEQGA